MSRPRFDLWRVVLACVLVAGLGTACGNAGSDTTKRVPVPDKTVVLTFDDASRSHLEFVAPLLRRYNLPATFFVTAYWMNDRQRFLDWAEIGALHRMGFEIGSHSVTHAGWHLPDAAEPLAEDCAEMNEALAKVGVPKPICFAWPGSVFGPEGRRELMRQGFRFARRGLHPEYPPGEMRGGTLYDPRRHDPMLIPSAGDSNPTWTFEHFERIVAGAKDGKIAVLAFHGVPDLVNYNVSTPPRLFERYIRYLAENQFNVIAMKDLNRYVDPDVHPPDPMIQRRVPDER